MIVGVSLMSGIYQVLVQQVVYLFLFFWQEGIFVGVQLVFVVFFIDIDVQIGRIDVYIVYDQYWIFFVEFGFQIVLQILIECCFGWEFGFMIVVFILREIVVNYCDVVEG